MNTSPLVPCGGGHRPVRAAEAACPFCAHARPNPSPPATAPGPGLGLSRGGVLAFAAAFPTPACQSQSGSTTVQPPVQAEDAGMVQTIYGGPPAPTSPAPVDIAVPADAAMPLMPSIPPTVPVVGPLPHHANHPAAAPAYDLAPVVDPPRRPTSPGSMSTRYGGPPPPFHNSDR